MFKFPHLSAGYAGRVSRTQTLNSGFFSLFSPERIVGERQAMPQRIPRHGFFIELCELERSADFRDQWRRRVRTTDTIFRRAIRQGDGDSFINAANSLLRLGAKIPPSNSQLPSIAPAEELDLRLLVALDSLQDYLSGNRSRPPLEQLEKLCRQTLTKRLEHTPSGISALIQFVVAVHRYSRSERWKSRASEVAEALWKALRRFRPGSFLQVQHTAIAFRGIAMVQSESFSADECLSAAQSLSAGLKAENALQDLVARENALVLNQTLGKWWGARGDTERARHHFEQMTAIDPWDSTGHSELGLFLLEQDQHREAAQALVRAKDLGPPGVGMNSYFAALALKQSGLGRQAYAALRVSERSDPESLSPILLRLEWAIENRANQLANRLAERIWNDRKLRQQLEEDELEMVGDLLGGSHPHRRSDSVRASRRPVGCV